MTWTCKVDDGACNAPKILAAEIKRARNSLAVRSPDPFYARFALLLPRTRWQSLALTGESWQPYRRVTLGQLWAGARNTTHYDGADTAER